MRDAHRHINIEEKFYSLSVCYKQQEPNIFRPAIYFQMHPYTYIYVLKTIVYFDLLHFTPCMKIWIVIITLLKTRVEIRFLSFLIIIIIILMEDTYAKCI